MKAQLIDGSVVELKKDCECGTHEGPHWLYLDRIDRELNLALPADARVQVEIIRLQEKCRNMELQGIVRILEDSPAPRGGKGR